MSRNRRKSFGWLLALVAVVGSIGMLLFLEMSLRTVMRVQTGAWPQTAAVTQYQNNMGVHSLFERHPFLNVAPRPAAETAVGGKSASFNASGYRSPERSTAPRTAGKRILCLGGSTTFDTLADSNETSWPWRLERALAEQGLDVEVWNAGVPTWTTAENVIALVTRDLELAPDLLVVMQGFNDMQPAAHMPHDPTYVKGHSERTLEALGFTLEAPSLVARSVLVEWLRTRVGVQAQAPALRRSQETPLPLPVATYRRNLRSLFAIAKEHQIEVLVVTQPLHPESAKRPADQAFLYDWLRFPPESVGVELKRFNQVLLEEASRAGVGAVDAASTGQWTAQHFGDPVHFADDGSQELVKVLVDPVLEALRPLEGR